MPSATETMYVKRAPFCWIDPREFSKQIMLADLEAMKLVLRGDSVIDWYRLNFRRSADIEWFLRVNGYDMRSEDDRVRLACLKREAIDYLQEIESQAIPASLREVDLTIPDLLKIASSSHRRSDEQMAACMILKVVHTLNHIDARELLHRCAISQSDILYLVENKVRSLIDTMQTEGFQLVEFSGSSKNRKSLISKLLSKRENHAAAIYDRIRFRMVTRSRVDILPILYFLGRNLCPFNYIIPNSSFNNLIPFQELVKLYPRFDHYVNYLKSRESVAEHDQTLNEFSSAGYRVINFVCDTPLHVQEGLQPGDAKELGRVIYSPVEFQIVDEKTHLKNQTGDGSHERYKSRQLGAICNRLGLISKSNGQELSHDVED